METIVLSLLLLAGPSISDADIRPSSVRAQAVAQATIINAESIVFGPGKNPVVVRENPVGGTTVLLPLAHSISGDSHNSHDHYVEFH